MQAARWTLALVAALLLASASMGIRADGAAPLLFVHDASGPLPQSAFPQPIPRFEQVYVGDTGVWEPALAFASDGSILYGWMGSTNPVGQVGPFNPTLVGGGVMRSADRGATWMDVTPSLGGRGGDPILWSDRETGRVWFELYSNGCLDISWSDDGGATWMQRPMACDYGGVQDHPTLWSGPALDLADAPALYPRTLYACYSSAYAQKCLRSLDGGVLFEPIGAPFGLDSALQLGGVFGVPSPVACTPILAGRGRADDLSGTLYLGSMDCGQAHVATSRDGGATWSVAILAPDAPPRTDPGAGGKEVDVEFATDAAGTTYAMWIDAMTGLPTYRATKDQGATWTPAITLSASAITTTKYPAIVAGDEGRVAFGYLGTTSARGDPTNEAWHAFVTIAVGADAGDALFATTSVSPADDPIHRGACEDRCFPTDDMSVSGMGDYIFLREDPATGALGITFNDQCLGACAMPGANGETPFEGDRASLGLQVEGATVRDT